jgi:O-antigen/teichoic acid export membrane protein
MTPLAVVGQYNVAMRLQEVVHMGVLKMSEVLFPHFSVTASDPLEKRASFFVRASWVLNVISVAALAPLIPTATSLITLWVDPATAVIGAPILRTLASAGVIGSGVNVYIYFAMASGQTPRIALITFTHSLMLITFTVLLILQFGALAAGAGYVVANLVRLMIVTRFSSDYFSPALPPATVLKYTLPPLVGGLLCAWLPVGAQLPPATGWLTLALAYVLAAATICVAALLATALTRAGRILIRETYTAGRQILLNRH